MWVSSVNSERKVANRRDNTSRSPPESVILGCASSYWCMFKRSFFGSAIKKTRSWLTAEPCSSLGGKVQERELPHYLGSDANSRPMMLSEVNDTSLVGHVLGSQILQRQDKTPSQHCMCFFHLQTCSVDSEHVYSLQFIVRSSLSTNFFFFFTQPIFWICCDKFLIQVYHDLEVGYFRGTEGTRWHPWNLCAKDFIEFERVLYVGPAPFEDPSFEKHFTSHLALYVTSLERHAYWKVS